MYKYNFATRWKNQVRLPRKVLSMQPEAKAESMHEAANCDFG